MEKSKAFVVRADTSAVTPVSKSALTYKNGFYTIKAPLVGGSTSSNTDSNANTSWSNNSTPSTVATPKEGIAPIPTDVMATRDELSSVQSELKRLMHAHQMQIHREKLMQCASYITPMAERERTTVECKDLENQITQLQTRQHELIHTVRNGLLKANQNKLKTLPPQSTAHRSRTNKLSNKPFTSNKQLAGGKRTIPSTIMPKPSSDSELISSHSNSFSAFTATSAPSRVAALPSDSTYTVTTATVTSRVQPTTSTSATPTSTTGFGAEVQPSHTYPVLIPTTIQERENNEKTVVEGIEGRAVVGRNTEEIVDKHAKRKPNTAEGQTSEEDVEVVKIITPAIRSTSKPHLLTKPMSMSPVPTPANEREAIYFSIRESRLAAIGRVSPVPNVEPERQPMVSFMADMGLVTLPAQIHLQKRRSERRKIMRKRFESSLQNHTRRNPYLDSLPNALAAKRPRRSTRSPPVLPPIPVKKPKRAPVSSASIPSLSDDDGKLHEDLCAICAVDGKLMLCDFCTLVYHLKCVGLKSIPPGKWRCPKCCGMMQPKPVNAQHHPNRNSSTAIGAVNDFVRTKLIKDNELCNQIQKNSELVQKCKTLKSSVEDLNTDIQALVEEEKMLKEENEGTRNMLHNLVEIVKAIKRAPKL